MRRRSEGNTGKSGVTKLDRPENEGKRMETNIHRGDGGECFSGISQVVVVDYPLCGGLWLGGSKSRWDSKLS